MATIATLKFPNRDMPLDLLLYVAIGREVPGLVEDTLGRNPGLADLGLFPPAGTQVLVAVPPPPGVTPPPAVVSLF